MSFIQLCIAELGERQGTQPLVSCVFAEISHRMLDDQLQSHTIESTVPFARSLISKFNTDHEE